MKNLVFQALADAARSGERVALGLISEVKGSSPQKVGAKALFYPDGRIQGTLGGGCLEAEIQQRAIESLRTGEAAKFDLLLDHDFGWDDGLICGGKVLGLILPNATALGAGFWSELAGRKTTIAWGVREDFSIMRFDLERRKRDAQYRTAPLPGPLPAPSSRREGEDHAAVSQSTAERPASVRAAEWLYEETISPPCCLWIAGAGHVAQAVAPLAAQLDFNVTVFDDRPALVNRNYFPADIALKADVWEKLTALTPPAVPSFALIVTRGHRHDALVLKEWIHKPFLFLGMIGSARKARTIFDHFREENLATAEELARVACPVGIRIKSRSVPEIAVSIMAQFIERRAALVPEAAGSPAAKAELV